MHEHIPLPRLRAFRQGCLAGDEEIERIAEHLAACPRCQEQYAALPEAEVVKLLLDDRAQHNHRENP
jgi:hypothetical protein